MLWFDKKHISNVPRPRYIKCPIIYFFDGRSLSRQQDINRVSSFSTCRKLDLLIYDNLLNFILIKYYSIIRSYIKLSKITSASLKNNRRIFTYLIKINLNNVGNDSTTIIKYTILVYPENVCFWAALAGRCLCCPNRHFPMQAFIMINGAKLADAAVARAPPLLCPPRKCIV